MDGIDTTAPTLTNFSFTDNDFHANPGPRWAALREQAPVWRFNEVGGWLVVGHDEVRAALGDSERFSLSRLDAGHTDVKTASSGPLARIEAAGLFHVDTATHRRLRRLVNPTFRAANIETHRPAVRELVDERVAALAGRDHVDLVADLIDGFAQEAIAALIGADPVDRAWFTKVSTPVLALVDPFISDTDRAAANDALGEIETFVAAELDRQRRNGTGLLAALAAAADDGDQLNGDELFALVAVLLLGGSETVTNMLGLGFDTLLEHPDQLAELHADPSRWPCAVDELLRWSYIGMSVTRFVRHDCTLGGVELSQGELLFVSIGSAVADDAHVSEPGRLDLSRPQQTPSLIFGAGAHMCLGAALARMEGTEMFAAVTGAYPNMARNGDPTFDSTLLLRGLTSLPVRLQS